jgi:hypothetical protein
VAMSADAIWRLCRFQSWAILRITIWFDFSSQITFSMMIWCKLCTYILYYLKYFWQFVIPRAFSNMRTCRLGKLELFYQFSTGAEVT